MARWILVIPGGIGAFLAIPFLVTFLGYLGSYDWLWWLGIPESQYSVFISDCVAPPVFVAVAAGIAPTHRFAVAILGTILIAALHVAAALALPDARWWTHVSWLIAIGFCVQACLAHRRS